MRLYCCLSVIVVAAGLLAGASQANACPDPNLGSGAGFLVPGSTATAAIPGSSYRATQGNLKLPAGMTLSRYSSNNSAKVSATPPTQGQQVSKAATARLQAKSSPAPQPLPKPVLNKPIGPRPRPFATPIQLP